MDDQLLYRYISGEATAEERLMVSAWMDQSPDNHRQVLDLRKVYHISMWNPTLSTEGLKQRTRPSITLRILRGVASVAALFVLAFVAVHLMYQNNIGMFASAQKQSIRVPSGQYAEVTLADGTVVWVNAASSLEFPTRFDHKERRVTLRGEAYFKVESNPESPFIVSCKEGIEVRATGTEFNVTAYESSPFFETSLLSGVVDVSAENGESYRLKPGHRLVREGETFALSTIENPDYYRWREGLVCFEDEPLPRLFEKLALHYDVKFEIHNTSISDHTYKYTGKFRSKDGVEHVLKVLQLNHSFDFKRNTEKNVIEIY